MNIVKSIAKTSSIYLVGQVLAKLVSFLMLPLYTNYISTEAYGMFDLVLAYAAIIVPLVGIGIWDGMLRFIIDTNDENKKAIVKDTGLILCFISILIFSLFYFGVIMPFFEFSNKILVYLYMITWLMQCMYIYCARGYKKNAVFAISGILSSFIMGIVSLICIFWLDLTIETLYLSYIISYIAQIIYIEWKTKLLFSFKLNNFSLEETKILIYYCLPNTVGTIFNWLLSNLNRIIIVFVLGYSVNGLFSIANKFVNIITVFVTVFILSWQESIFKIDNKEESNKLYNSAFGYYTLFLGISLCVVMLGTSIIFPFFVNGDFGEAYNLIPFMYIQFYMSCLTWFLSSIVSASKKTVIFLIEKLFIGIINIVILYFTITKIGAYASPISLFISELLGMFIFVKLLKSKASIYIKIPYRLIFISLTVQVVCAMIFIKNSVFLNFASISIIVGIVFIIYNKEIQQLFKQIKMKRSLNHGK